PDGAGDGHAGRSARSPVSAGIGFGVAAARIRNLRAVALAARHGRASDQDWPGRPADEEWRQQGPLSSPGSGGTKMEPAAVSGRDLPQGGYAPRLLEGPGY